MTTSKHTIVYAEDDLDDVFILKQAFEKHDHIKVLHAPDGKLTLRILENLASEGTLPCLVILDINMPVMNGKETLQNIRKHDKFHSLAVVLFTTSNSQEDKAFAESFKATLITKPVDFSTLETIVEKFIENCNFEVNKLSENSPLRNR